MIPILIGGFEDIYMKILLIYENSPDSAANLYKAYEDSLPDSIKLDIYRRFGWDVRSFLEDAVRMGTKDAKVWETYLYYKIISSKMPKEKLEGFIKRHIKKFEKIPRVLNFVGEIYENYGMLKEAKEFYFKSSKMGYKTAYKNLAIIYAKLGKCDSSLKAFENFSINDVGDNYEKRRVFLAMGICFEEDRNYQKAIEYYQKAYEIQKDTLLGFKIAYLLAKRDGDEALTFLAGMYDDIGFSRPNLYWGYALIMSKSLDKVKDGIRELGELLAIKGDEPQVRNILTHAFLRFGDTITALRHAKRAFELKPDDDDYRLAYLMLLSGVEENPRKFGYYLREKDKKDPIGKLVFARYYRKSGSKWMAVKYYSKLVDIDPKNISLLLEAYYYFKGLKDWKNAKKTLKNLTLYYPDSLGYWFELGDIYLRLKQPDSIYSLYYNIVEKMGFKLNDCDLASVLNNWAYTMALLNYKLDTAKVLIDKAYKLCKNEYILDSRGWIYFLLGNVEEGKNMVKEAAETYMKSNRMNPEVLLHLSIISCISGDDNAKGILKEVWKYLDSDYRDFYKNFLRMCK